MQRHPGVIVTAIILQALGVSLFWEWFNGVAFNANGAGYVIWKMLFIGGLLGVWSYALPRWMQKKTGVPLSDYRLRDALAGMPLVLLPVLGLFRPMLAAMAKPFAMKLTAFVWMPWWSAGRIINPEAFAILMAAGILVMAAVLTKLTLVLLTLRAQAPTHTLAPKHLFVIGFVAYLAILSWPAITSAPQSGEVPQLLVLQAMAFDSSFSIERVLGRADYYSYHPLQKITYNGFADYRSRIYLPVAPGMPLLFMAFFLLQGRWLASVLVMLFAAGAAAQLYGVCRDLNFSQRSSLNVWLLALLNAPLLLYGYQLYEVTAASFFMLWALRMALRIGQPGVNPLPAAASAGFAAGLLWLGTPRLIIPALLLMGLVLRRSHAAGKAGVGWLGVGIMAIPAVCALVFYSSVFSLFWDHPVYHFNGLWEPAAWVNGLALLADRYAGLLWNAPVWLAGAAGVFWLWHAVGAKHRELAATILLMLASGLAFAMIFPDAHAEGSSLNRYLAPLLPILGIGLAAFLDSSKPKSLWPKVILLLGAWGVVVAIVQAIFPFLTQEAARLKLAELIQFLGWGYTLLPSLSAGPGIADILFGGVAGFVAVYLVYSGVVFLNNQKTE